MDEPHSAQLEGFSAAIGWAGGSGPRTVRVVEGGVTCEVTIGAGHKTGLYLDQRENRARVGALARDREVLDAFSYTAGFACHALRGGARRAICIESSPEAIAAARQNLELNGFTARAEIRASNVFDELRRLERDGARFGVIILDPPPFARSRSALDAAARGYKEINLRALRLLERGGHLFTFSCSHHVSDTMFDEICRDAAADAGVRLRVVARLGQASDHPVLLSIPETRYSKDCFSRVSNLFCWAAAGGSGWWGYGSGCVTHSPESQRFALRTGRGGPTPPDPHPHHPEPPAVSRALHP